MTDDIRTNVGPDQQEQARDLASVHAHRVAERARQMQQAVNALGAGPKVEVPGAPDLREALRRLSEAVSRNLIASVRIQSGRITDEEFDATTRELMEANEAAGPFIAFQPVPAPEPPDPDPVTGDTKCVSTSTITVAYGGDRMLFRCDRERGHAMPHHGTQPSGAEMYWTQPEEALDLDAHALWCDLVKQYFGKHECNCGAPS